MRQRVIIVFIVFSYLITFINTGHCQIDNSIQNYLPSTPTAASFVEHAEVPVSLYSGTANINLPITTIADKKLSHNIYLSYHSQGIKVSETASWAGLGWTLNAGGVISRSVRIAPDEDLYDSQEAGYLIDGASPSSYDTPAEALQVIEGDIDIASDIYYYNVDGFSGSFFFDNNGEVHKSRENDDVRIEYTLTGYDYNKLIWRLISPTGTIYYFGDTSVDGYIDDVVSYSQNFVQGTQTTSLPVRNNPLVDSWYLVRIESYDGKSHIDFDYEWETYSFRNIGSSTTYVDPDGRNIVNNAGGPSYNPTHNLLITESLSPRLKSITSSNRIIEFIPDLTESRRDLDDRVSTLHPKTILGISNTDEARALSSIELRDLSNNCLTKFDFDFDYYRSSDAGFWGDPLVLNARTDAQGTYYPDMKRLRLAGFEKLTCSGSDPIEHTFTYNTDQIARRLSHAQDYWGYQNGINSNTTVFPRITINESANTSPLIDLSHLTNYADRAPSVVSMDNGMLEEINYPEGGTVSFDYEPNDYNTIEVQEVLTSPNPASVTNCPGPFSTSCDGDVDLSTGVVSLPPLPNTRYELLTQAVRATNDGNSALIQIHLEIKRDGIWQLVDETILDASNSYSSLRCYSEDFIRDTSSSDDFDFRLSVVETGRKVFLEIIVKKFVRTEVNTNQIVGGLRVKSISEDPKTGPIVKRLFNYGDPGQTGYVSSGQLIGLPAFFEMLPAGSELAYANPALCLDIGYRFYSSSISPIASTQGTHFGYQFVTETYDSGNNGKKITEYNIDPTHEVEFIRPFPIVPEYFIDPLAGHVKNTQIINQDDVTVHHSESYVYGTEEWNDPLTAVSYALNNYTTCSIQGNTALSVDNYLPQAYPNVSYTIRPLIKTSILDGVSTSIIFQYDNLNQHIQPLSETMTNSDGKSYATNYTYYYNYNNSVNGNQSAVQQRMSDKNLLLPAWQVEKSVDGTIMDGGRTLWSFYNNSSGLPTTATTGNYLYPKNTERFEVTFDASGNRINSPAPEWKNQLSINSYDMSQGKQKSITQEGWNDPIIFTYTSKGRIHKINFDQYEWKYDYESDTDLLDIQTNVDNTIVDYVYDGHLRLESVSSCTGASSAYTYIYGNGSSSLSYIQTDQDYPIFGEELQNEVITDKIFVDGLGRVVQSMKVGQAPDPNPSGHIISSISYDNVGRPIRSYEPILHTGATNYVLPSGAFTETIYEESFLRRPQQVIPPSWYATTYNYGSNGSSEVINPATNLNFASDIFNVTTVTDPDNKVSKTYTDKRGRVVASRNQDLAGSTNKVTTFNFYDDKERIAKVVPPASTYSSAHLNFEYLYEVDDLIKSKKVPDKAIEHYFYNDRDLLAYRQDGNMAMDGNWYGTIYDSYGRILQEGFSTAAPGAHNSYDEAAVSDILIDNVYGTAGIEKDKIKTSSATIMISDDAISRTYAYDACGRLDTEVGNSIALLTDPMSYTMSYVYDDANNILSHLESVPNNGESLSMNCRFDYDHVGRRIAEYNKVNSYPEEQISANTYTVKDQKLAMSYGGPINNALQVSNYDYLPNRFLKSINDPSSLGSDIFALELNYDNNAAMPQKNGNIASAVWSSSFASNQKYEYEYDYLNRLKVAQFSGTQAGRYDTDYSYDARGNITSLNRKGYDGTSTGYIDQLSFTPVPGMNRIQSITDGATTPNLKSKGYKSFSGGNFSYDANGNTDYDPGRKADILYNHLNLPDIISVPDSNAQVNYYYSADGRLHKKETIRDGVPNADRLYVGKFEYTNGVIDIINIPTGYIQMTDNMPDDLVLSGVDASSITHRALRITSDRTVMTALDVSYKAEEKVTMTAGFKTDLNTHYLATIEQAPPMGVSYNYIITDHLGNTRAIFNDENGDGTIVASEVSSEEHFYPFGLSMNGDWNDNSSFDYKYNGKERQSELDLGYYNYGARFYDPTIGRFTSTDPLADTYSAWSPYHYTYNNPIIHTDPDGRSIIKGAKALYNVGKRAYKTYKKTGKVNVKSVGKALKDEALDIIDTGATLFDGNASLGEKAFAVFDLATGFGDEAKAAGKALGIADDVGDGLKKVPKAKRGKGSVPPSERDPKRAYTKGEKQEMLDSQGGKCPNCNDTKTVDQVDGHHNTRHADGGRTTKENGTALCKDCHKDVHRKN